MYRKSQIIFIRFNPYWLLSKFKRSTSFLFLIWISFIDENNLLVLTKQINNLEEKQDEIDSLKIEITELELRLERLNNDPEELERFARENFLMKKENEDIVIFRDQ